MVKEVAERLAPRWQRAKTVCLHRHEELTSVAWNCNGLTREKFERIHRLTARSPSLLAVCLTETKHSPEPMPRTIGVRQLPHFVAYRKPCAIKQLWPPRFPA